MPKARPQAAKGLVTCINTGSWFWVERCATVTLQTDNPCLKRPTLRREPSTSDHMAVIPVSIERALVVAILVVLLVWLISRVL